MDQNRNCAGVCGEIAVEKPFGFCGIADQRSLVTSAQIFEYKISNIMDKALESVIGFISVLPGAFSAYRWDAIKNDENGKGALKIYFKPLLPGPEMSVFEKVSGLSPSEHSCPDQ